MKLVELVEIEKNRWRVARETSPVARSSLPRPYVISDEMPPTEQCDGVFYTSKAKFRAVGRALGLTEVGNEKPKPKVRATANPKVKEARRQSLRKAIEKFRSA